MVFNPVVSGGSLDAVNLQIWFDSVSGYNDIQALLPDGSFSSLNLESGQFLNYQVAKYGGIRITLNTGLQCSVSGDFYGNGYLSDGGSTCIIPTGDISFISSVS